MKINYMLDKGGYAPIKMHDTDAGFDLKCPELQERYVCIPMRQHIMLDLKLHMEIPKGYFGYLKTRSSLNAKGITCEGVIDSGYTGSIKAILINNSGKDVWFKSEDRIAQIVFLPIPDVELEEVTEFEKTDRGDNGLGSTGL